MPQDKRLGNAGKSKGFTLFEMVVVICAIVILYMVAVQRLNDLPAAAERASFLGTLEQIKTGVNFEMITSLAGGRFHELKEKAGTNPMNFLLETPGNYLGEIDKVTDESVARRRSWYFETSTGELVYMVGGSSVPNVFVKVGGIDVNLGQIRFHVSSVYSDERGQLILEGQNSIGHEQNQNAWQGIQLLPVKEYRWQSENDVESVASVQ